MIISPMPTGNGAFVLHKILEAGIKGYRVHPYSPYREFFPATLPFSLRGRQPSLIHTTADYGFFFKRKGIPLILTLHNFVLDSLMMRYSTILQCTHYKTDLRWFTKASLKIADVVTSVSHFSADLVKRELNYTSDICVIYNGIDTHKFTPAPAGAPDMNKTLNVLFAGNLSLRKGANLLPEIAKKLKPGIQIGYTRGLRKCTPLPAMVNLKNLGEIAIQDMPALYQNADILLFPSVREGFGLVIAEAMACGLPVVATNASAIPELVIHGKGGFLCEIGNATDFAEKINLLAEAPELRREMGEFNRARVEKYFTQERMIREYSELFEKTLDHAVED